MYQSVLDLSNIELPCFKSQKNVQNYAGASVRSQAAHPLGCVLVHVIVQKGCGHGHTARMAWRAGSWVLLRYTARMAWRAGLWVLLPYTARMAWRAGLWMLLRYTARKACRACLWVLLRYTARMAGLLVGASAVCRACLWVLRRYTARREFAHNLINQPRGRFCSSCAKGPRDSILCPPFIGCRLQSEPVLSVEV